MKNPLITWGISQLILVILHIVMITNSNEKTTVCQCCKQLILTVSIMWINCKYPCFPKEKKIWVHALEVTKFQKQYIFSSMFLMIVHLVIVKSYLTIKCCTLCFTKKKTKLNSKEINRLQFHKDPHHSCTNDKVF